MVGDALVEAGYTYIVLDAVTGVPINNLPLSGVRFTRAGSAEPGALDAVIGLRHPKATESNLLPKRRELAVFRNDQLVWNGPITNCQASTQAGVVQIRAREAHWWIWARTIQEDMSYGEDVLDLARILIDYATGKTNGDLYRFTRSAGTAGVTQQLAVLADERRYIGQVLADLAAHPTEGFDFRMVYSANDEHDVTRHLQLGAPSLGVELPNHVLEHGAGLEDLGVEQSLEQGGNRTHLIPGLGDVSTLDHAGSIAAGDPLVEYVLQRPDLDDAQDNVQGAAAELRRDAKPPVETFTATFHPRAALPHGFADPLDLVWLKASEGYLQVDDWRRVAAVTTVPPEKDQPERVELTLQATLDDLGA